MQTFEEVYSTYDVNTNLQVSTSYSMFAKQDNIERIERPDKDASIRDSRLGAATGNRRILKADGRGRCRAPRAREEQTGHREVQHHYPLLR